MLYEGIKLACSNYGVDLVGGDTTSSLTGLTISMTCVGSVKKGGAVFRKGACLNDLICVSGNLGAAYMGLQLLEREKVVLDQTPGFEPDFSGMEYLLERQLNPEARKDIIEALAAHQIVPTTMIDISDGLASELLHICTASQCGCRIYEEKIPIDYETASLAGEMNMNLTTVALNGGEDYELLFTAPLNTFDTLLEIPDVHVIGHISNQTEGCCLVTRDDTTIQLMAQGWKND
jgi:thiamine-monophosphate kinase